MKSDLYIPKTIKVGFQERNDTFTGKLAYIVYTDDKGVLRKENSWTSWRDKSIKVLDIDNVPTSGYMFNKGVERYGYFGSGRSVIRVHDPREFEFEIGVDNLMGILMNSDVSKRDIVEECVFAWAGKDLVLLPVSSQEYRDSIEYTKKQAKNISARDYKKGHTFSAKKNDQEYIYIGYYDWWDHSYMCEHICAKKRSSKKHVFYNGEKFVTPSTSTLSECISDEVHQDFADLVDEFQVSINFSPITKCELIDLEPGAFHPYDRFYVSVNETSYEVLLNLYEVDESATSIYATDIEVNKCKQTTEKNQIGFKYLNDEPYSRLYHSNETKIRLEVEKFRKQLGLPKYEYRKSLGIDKLRKILEEFNFKRLVFTRDDDQQFCNRREK